jgi:HAD superfamily hydrolase (TIGR01509 family)
MMSYDGATVLHGKELLIFDFDGTLVDTSLLHQAAFETVLAPWNIRVDYPKISGMKTLDAMRQLILNSHHTVTDSELTALVRDKQQYVRQLMRHGVSTMPGADAFLRWARPRYRMALVSSGSTATITQALKQLGYTDWFDPIICAEDVTHAKPDPEGFLMALELTDVLASEALVFEDSEAGFKAAIQANLAYVDVRALNGFSLRAFDPDNVSLLERL